MVGAAAVCGSGNAYKLPATVCCVYDEQLRESEGEGTWKATFSTDSMDDIMGPPKLE